MVATIVTNGMCGKLKHIAAAFQYASLYRMAKNAINLCANGTVRFFQPDLRRQLGNCHIAFILGTIAKKRPNHANEFVVINIFIGRRALCGGVP
jgi:hypothetical protein